MRWSAAYFHLISTWSEARIGVEAAVAAQTSLAQRGMSLHEFGAAEGIQTPLDLVADDNSTNRMVVSKVLWRAFQHCVANGEDAFGRTGDGKLISSSWILICSLATGIEAN